MIVRDGKTIEELQAEPDYEWQDGDDSALYDAGYAAGKQYAVEILDIALSKDDESLSLIPTRWLLKIMRHSILNEEEAND